MKSNEQEAVRTWDQLDFYLANLQTLMQIWDDFLHEFKDHPKDDEAPPWLMEALHVATSCLVGVENPNCRVWNTRTPFGGDAI